MKIFFLRKKNVGRESGPKDDQSCDFDFNIGGGSATMQELVQLVLELSGSASQVMLLPAAESQLELSSSVSSEKAREVLGFQPKVPLRFFPFLLLIFAKTC